MLAGFYSLRAIHRHNEAKIWLILGSIFFYCYYTFQNLPVLVFSVVFNFLIGKKVRGNKHLFFFGLFINVLTLAFFKYKNLSLLSLNWFGNFNLNPADLIFPLGLSFFTIQQISYLSDCYEGLIENKKFIDYSLFITFFPHLISGPILDPKKQMPQLENLEKQHATSDRFSLGLFLITIGIAKKVLIAEFFAPYAKIGFDEAIRPDFFLAWKSTISYSFQLYYDFSGYTDMSIGLAHLFLLKLPQNFNSPFKSLSVIEFWSRWHITLSQFITTYVFTPTVRLFNKISFEKMMLATLISMLISGVWHGDDWTFVLYGLIHGFALIFNHLRKKKKKKLSPKMAWFFTFVFINLGLVIFRSASISRAHLMIKGLLGLNGVIVPKIGIKNFGILSQYGFSLGSYFYPKDYLFLMMTIFCFISIFKFKNSLELEAQFKPSQKIAFLCGIIFSLCLFGMNSITEFIYFKF